MTVYCTECYGKKCTSESEEDDNEREPIPISCTPTPRGDMREPKWRKGQFYYAGSF